MLKPKKLRLDEYLVKCKLAENKTKAQALIMSGIVYCDTRKLDKPGLKILDGMLIELKGNKSKWVSRGGDKLSHALDSFCIKPYGLTALDVGASTGGFSQVLLNRGVSKLYCVDVGYGQLDPKVSSDSRVIVLDRTNARYLDNNKINIGIDLITCDVSFISLMTVLPAVLKLTNSLAQLIALIKPQFEVGKGVVGKGGIVKDVHLHEQVCNRITDWINNQKDWQTISLIPSPIKGKNGNKEFLIFAKKDIY